MSPAALFVIFVYAPAAAILGIIIARAVWARRRQPRQVDQEPVHRRPSGTTTAPPAAGPGGVPLPPAPRSHAESTPPGPAPHTGADAGYVAQLQAMNATARTAPTPPLDGVELDWYRRLGRYEALTAAAYETCAIRIGELLARFAPDFDQAVAPVGSIKTALLRMRVGIREPVEATRTTETDTGQWDVGALRELFAAEDLAVAR